MHVVRIIGCDELRVVILLDGRKGQGFLGIIGRHGILPVLQVQQVEISVVRVSVGAVRRFCRDMAVSVVSVAGLRGGRVPQGSCLVFPMPLSAAHPPSLARLPNHWSKRCRQRQGLRPC